MNHAFLIAFVPAVAAAVISFPIIWFFATRLGTRMGAQGYRSHDIRILTATGGAAFVLSLYLIGLIITNHLFPYVPTDFSGRTADQIIQEMRERYQPYQGNR